MRLTVVFKSYLFSHVFWLDVKARDTCCFSFQKTDICFHLHVGHWSYDVDFKTDEGVFEIDETIWPLSAMHL